MALSRVESFIMSNFILLSVFIYKYFGELRLISLELRTRLLELCGVYGTYSERNFTFFVIDDLSKTSF
jgi:hypothetical protein